MSWLNYLATDKTLKKTECFQCHHGPGPRHPSRSILHDMHLHRGSLQLLDTSHVLQGSQWDIQACPPDGKSRLQRRREHPLITSTLRELSSVIGQLV